MRQGGGKKGVGKWRGPRGVKRNECKGGSSGLLPYCFAGKTRARVERGLGRVKNNRYGGKKS